MAYIKDSRRNLLIACICVETLIPIYSARATGEVEGHPIYFHREFGQADLITIIFYKDISQREVFSEIEIKEFTEISLFARCTQTGRQPNAC